MSSTLDVDVVLGVSDDGSIAVAETVVEIDARVSPPTNDELYSYFGPQKRWVSVVMSAAFLLAAFSIFNFARRSVWLYPFLLLLALNVLGMVVSLSSSLYKRRLNLDQHKRLVHSWKPSTYPSVDVFLPTCGEDLAVLRNTYWHVAAMQWSGVLTIWVLDDADRPEVREIARQRGFEYVVRPNRGHMKKAGNMHHAYGISRGDIIAVFDADFCPRPDYLHHLVPYLDAPGIGIVQSPQVFDSDTNKMGWLERSAGATQELFYRWVQPTRDAVGAAICVGTNALYRRKALERTDGFAQIEHSEDVHTGIALLRQGFATQYVPVLLAKGLCPDDLGGFVNQQYRWCNGSITLLRSGTAHSKPLTMRQRLCFWSGFLYYMTTALNVFAVQLPSLIMAIFLASDVRAPNYLPFLGGVWVYLVLLPSVFTTRWRFEVLRVQMAYSFSHAIAITDKLRRRSAGWVATGAVTTGNSLTRRICRVTCYWLALSTIMSWAVLLFDTQRYGVQNFWPMALFIAGYSYLSVPLAIDAGKILRREARLRRGELGGERTIVRGRAALSHLSPGLSGQTADAGARQLRWPEAWAFTAVIGLIGMLASGWVDVMLPWVH